MRPTAAGTIIDASALVALRRSIYAQTLVQFSVREFRPLVIPATALYAATLIGANPEDFEAEGFTIIPLSGPIVPGVALLAQAATSPVPIDIAHVAWESSVTQYPVLTDAPERYEPLNVSIDLEVL